MKLYCRTFKFRSVMQQHIGCEVSAFIPSSSAVKLGIIKIGRHFAEVIFTFYEQRWYLQQGVLWIRQSESKSLQDFHKLCCLWDRATPRAREMRGDLGKREGIAGEADLCSIENIAHALMFYGRSNQIVARPRCARWPLWAIHWVVWFLCKGY